MNRLILVVALAFVCSTAVASGNDVICIDGFESGYPGLCQDLHVEMVRDEVEIETFGVDGARTRVTFELEFDVAAIDDTFYIPCEGFRFEFESPFTGLPIDVPESAVSTALSAPGVDQEFGCFYEVPAGAVEVFYLEVEVESGHGFTGPIRIQPTVVWYLEVVDDEPTPKDHELYPPNDFESSAAHVFAE